MLFNRRTALLCLASSTVLGACAGEMTLNANIIDVRAPALGTNGVLSLGARQFPCALGRSGIVTTKREGDGGTPAGDFPLREVRYRPDRIPPPSTKGLPVRPLQATDGWCDAPTDPAYNQPVRLPYPASAERMWRDDHLYDLLAIVGYNDSPTVPGRGSAIFLHVARGGASAPRLAATEGCVAVRLEDLLAILAESAPSTRMRIALA
jgi:L,D-peptidoglycan transpeptidase YkuD (ErfK/YbiS/YcfS/YnhG family)